jgi:hypothetical protein
MPARSTPTGAARRRARTPQSATSYRHPSSPINAEDDVWACEVPADEWPEWTDQVAFTLAELPDFARRERGRR